MTALDKEFQKGYMLAVQGNITFCKLATPWTAEQAQERTKNSMYPKTDPYYTVSIENAKVTNVISNSGNLDDKKESNLIKLFKNAKFYTNKNGNTSFSIEPGEYSKHTFCTQVSEGTIEPDKEPLDLAVGEPVTLIIDTYQPRKFPAEVGLTLRMIIHRPNANVYVPNREMKLKQLGYSINTSNDEIPF